MKYHQQNHWDWGSIKLEDKVNIFQRLFIIASLIAILVFSFPGLAAAHTVNQVGPLVFPVQNLAPVKIVYQNLPEAEFIWSEQPINKEKIEKLRNYLASKNSPMADYAEELIAQHHYVFIIAISFAESNYCKVQIRQNNCWGIGGTRPEGYASLPAAFARADELIQRYHDLGMTSPQLMRNTWVGWQNDSWIIAVNQEITRIQELGL